MLTTALAVATLAPSVPSLPPPPPAPPGAPPPTLSSPAAMERSGLWLRGRLAVFFPSPTAGSGSGLGTVGGLGGSGFLILSPAVAPVVIGYKAGLIAVGAGINVTHFNVESGAVTTDATTFWLAPTLEWTFASDPHGDIGGTFELAGHIGVGTSGRSGPGFGNDGTTSLGFGGGMAAGVKAGVASHLAIGVQLGLAFDRTLPDTDDEDSFDVLGMFGAITFDTVI